MLKYGVWFAAVLRPPSDSLAKVFAGVIELTAADFDSRVQDGREGPWFVKFYAPWCGHCKRMASDWEQIAVSLDGAVHVARVDATKETGLAKEWGVEGFPTLRFIQSERVYTYSGPRTADKLEAWARTGWRSDFADALPGKEASDVVSLTGATFNERITSDPDEAWFVLFYVPSCEHCKNMAAEFQAFALRPSLASRRVRVAKVNAEKDEELSGKWVSVGFPTMKLFASGKAYTYSGERTADDIEKWVLETLPPPPNMLEQLLQMRILGMDPLVPAAFVMGLLAALLVWRLAFSGKGACRSSKEVTSAQDCAKKDE